MINKTIKNILIWMPIFFGLSSGFLGGATLIISISILPFLFLLLWSSRYRDANLILIPAFALVASGLLVLFIDVRSILYLMYDFLAAFVTIYFLKHKKRTMFLFESNYIFSLIYIVIYLCMLMMVGAYDSDNRYVGPLYNVNISIYYLGYSLCFVVLFNKKKYLELMNSRGAFLALMIIAISFFASESRSVLFFLLLLIFFLGDFYFVRRFVILAGLVILLMIFMGLSDMGGGAAFSRFDLAEISYQSRANVSLDLFYKILDSIVMPHGPRYSVDYIVAEYGNPDMHPHNDFLAGILDYGWFYVIYIGLILYFWMRAFGRGGVSLIMLLVYFSTALHGYFSSIIFLYPAVMLAELYTQIRLSKSGNGSE